MAKLPKWAQDQIADLTRRLSDSEKLKKRMVDEQTESPIFVDDWYSTPPVKRYVQSPTGHVTVVHAGVKVELYLAPKDDGQRHYGVEVRFHHCNSTFGGAVIVPTGNGTIAIVDPITLKR